jgi:hypothetical protein
MTTPGEMNTDDNEAQARPGETQGKGIPEVDLYLGPEAAMKLARMANEQGVTVTYLVNKWVYEGLNREG